jgi:hypothetical protein
MPTRETSSRLTGKDVIPLTELLTIQSSGIQGEGVYAEQDIPGEFVLGEIVGPLCPEPYDSPTCVVYNDQFCMEPTDAGVPVHRMNHSCDPNCEFDWIGDTVLVQTRRSVVAGEELTIDYECVWENNPYVDASGLPVCHCGSVNCRGWIVSLEALERQPVPPGR